MLNTENLAANLCGLLAQQGNKDPAVEWKILGQERDGSLLVNWVAKREDGSSGHIGIFDPNNKTFDILNTFPEPRNIIQASVNSSRTLLTYVIKEEPSGAEEMPKYSPFLVEINNAIEREPFGLLAMERSKQVMVQFLWKKRDNFDKTYRDKFLVMIHEECVLLFTANIKKIPSADDDGHSSASLRIDFKHDNWYCDTKEMGSESIVRNFTWCQWDPEIQSLYYIHYKPQTRNTLEKDDEKEDLSPTLSAFQFHDDLPMETVLNIPLNLPKIPITESGAKVIYEDDTIPLRIHDSSLNLVIVSNEIGMLFVCHYYLYMPVKPPEESGKMESVHLAYSVTILHHGCVIHCVVPGISWEKAKLMKPTFALHGDHHLLVFQADLFAHLLDIGLSHEPCCHIVCPPPIQIPVTHLVPCVKWGSLTFDSATLNLVSMSVSKSQLIEAFRSDTSLDNRLSILHYFAVHSVDMDTVAELIGILMEHPMSLDLVALMKEVLIGGTYAAVKKGLPPEAAALIRYLPLTMSNPLKPIQAKVSDLSVGISHETLYNTNMMLLSSQQRLSPYRTDIWTCLWDRLNENKEPVRFTAEQVVEKLMFSLACYQPETLSRCTTPMSPSGPKIGADNSFSLTHRSQSTDLPFIELEECTASKQEHVISVNLRELSVHLAKYTAKQNIGFRWLKNSYDQAPTYVHTVASMFAAAQYEMSKTLCGIVCRYAGVDAQLETLKGFPLIDSLSSSRQYALYSFLERFCLAAQSLAYPLPQGFSSFFAYLGFRTLSYDMFLQYVQRHVFELQIDVMKAILQDMDDSPEALRRKLSLLSMLPRSRARRLLNKWNHTASLQIRARDHATNILCGVPVFPRGSQGQLKQNVRHGGSYPENKETIAPLDTFLDLLTAKANLNEIDFNLLIDATISSLEQ
ncbi:protein pigeon [Lutzomyia longipalpis]|uniref:protein pigeon n=1 Tax=Lutzomyia longipalpis TaxID=7200 RepID=UPI0024847223|nr:protein pigeon [Lutzomyia longipalpis]